MGSKSQNIFYLAAGIRPKTIFLLGFLALISAQTAPQPAVSILEKPAPQFIRTDLDGNQIDLSALRGKVVLINFWASWCGPCLVEMPVFASWRSQYSAQGLELIGVSMDDGAAPAELAGVRKLRVKLGVNYPIIMADEQLGNLYGRILGLPVTYLIDRKGIVRARWQGEAKLDGIEATLRVLLAEPR
jgi:thiol-disulfide isomerase/thioredoxin